MMDIHEAAKVIEENFSSLREADQEFIGSLLSQYKKKGSLSDKQAHWFIMFGNKLSGQPDGTRTIRDVSKIFDLFGKAKKSIGPHARITLRFGDNKIVKISWYISSSQFNDHLKLQTNSIGSLSAGYLGRLSSEGVLTFVADVDEDVKEAIEVVLSSFARDPIHVARRFGSRVGKCCFCNKPIYNPDIAKDGCHKKCLKKWDMWLGPKKDLII